ncbi:MAG: hypothetical protein CEE38_09540 [Planctomycetes bacterium B3_Pla]|nr:MAG: hypothetical protein CEE38_09540 [Planctomycetes bacterium B3_Pla]
MSNEINLHFVISFKKYISSDYNATPSIHNCLVSIERLPLLLRVALKGEFANLIVDNHPYAS